MKGMDEVVAGLESLREPAPPRVLSGTLVRTDLADGYVVRQIPVGSLYVAFGSGGVTFCWLAESPEEFAAAFARRHQGRRLVAADDADVPAGLDAALESGRLGGLQVDLSSVAAFQRDVLRKIAEIPPGEVRPYSWVAAEIGRPAAIRAVGTALARNPVPILLPCHRIVRTDGRIGNYGFGPAAKRAMLAAEGADPEELETLARNGVRYVGSDTTHVYCHPTCRHARRIGDTHRVTFGDASEAAAAGYRPCRDCRPVSVAA